MHSFKVFAVVSMLCTGSLITEGQRCQNKGTESIKDVVVYESVRYGHYVEIECCSHTGGQIIWMKFNKDTSQWKNYTPDREDVLLLESNQILAIQSAMFEDTGSYKCQERNGSATADLKKFKLNIVACDKLARGPFPVSPLPCPETVAKERDTITLPCTGYFGCGDEGHIRLAVWYVSVDASDNWKEVSEVDERYTETKFEQDSGTVLGSNLTIKDVSRVDFKRKFICLLDTPQTVKGQSSVVVTLKDKYRTEEESVLSAGFSSMEVVVVLVVVVAVLLTVTVLSVGLCVHQKVLRNRKATRKEGEDKWMAVNYKDIKDSGQMLP